MSEHAHTPGPWTAVIHEDGRLFPHVQIGPELPYSDGSGTSQDRITVNVGATPEMVEAGVGGGTTMETADANARLIAQAPTLLRQRDELRAALFGLMALHRRDFGLEGAHDEEMVRCRKALAAIEKATP